MGHTRPMTPKPHPYFSSRGQIARERRQKRAFIRGLLGSAFGAVGVLWLVIGAPGLEAITPAPDPVAVEAREARERSVYYPNCAAARAAGAAPIRWGDPGYRDGLDGDNDGIACEPIRRF